MSDDIAIKVDHLSKTFKLPHEKQSSLKGALINKLRGGNRSFERQKVLDNISFEIKKGEFFGIVGRNGSGKSTLLKLLAGIYAPSEGALDVRGKLTPFIELGVGFNPELTGRQNVYLNGALLGFNRADMNEMYEDIVTFAELDKFMDQKLKNYSSGMQVRLAFSIAIRAKSDILLIDEVLAVGDAAFQKKCFDHFIQLKKQKATVVLVTHDMAAIERFCDRALVIHKSKAIGVFDPGEAATIYGKLNVEKQKPSNNPQVENDRWGTGNVKIEYAKVFTAGERTDDEMMDTVKHGDTMKVCIKTESKNDRDIVIGLSFIDQFGVNISGPNSKGIRAKSNQITEYVVEKLPLARGEYALTVAVFDKDINEEFDHWEKAAKMNVVSPTEVYGKVDFFGKWKSND